MSFIVRTLAVLALVGTALHDHIAWPADRSEAGEPHARRAAVSKTSGRDSLIESIPFIDDSSFINEELNRAREAARPGEGTQRKSLPREEVDIVVRTVLGECAHCSREETQTIVGVIFNRLASGRYGPTPTDVVLSRGQFTAHDRRHARWQNVWASHLPRTAAYSRIKNIVETEWQRNRPAHRCVNYYHPASMVPLGRVPGWAIGKPSFRVGGAVVVC